MSGVAKAVVTATRSKAYAFGILLCALALAPAACASASESAAWRFAPALAPPPPSGVAPAPYPVPVGEVGEVSFWAPNRGLLITGGSEAGGGPVASGLYAYDGVSWHQLSTVCGGSGGRIAWVGPDEFWTIADQRPGQILPPGGQAELQSISLCHFIGDQVVGSYAMPLGEPGSYMRMDAAACYGPTDCWFGGADAQAPNAGAFHLHWNGSSVAALYEPEDHAVSGMIDFDGQIYESVQIGANDAWLPGERPEHPAVLHKIAPGGLAGPCGSLESAFCDLVIFVGGHSLPEYGKEVLPDALEGFSMASDGPPSGVGASQLWAAADPVPNGSRPVGSKPASVTVLRYAENSHGERAWSQVLPNPAKTSPPLPPGETLSPEEVLSGGENIAPEPGTNSAWISLGGEGLPEARLARLEARSPAVPGEATGAIVEEAALPAEATEPSPVGYRGGAGPIACPAPHDCWMATNGAMSAAAGWLFHLTDGAAQTPNSDPLFDGEDGVIAYRPPDGGVPVIYPDAPPEDDSGAQVPFAVPPGLPESVPTPTARRKRGRSLLTHVRSRFVHHRVLEISFTLTARAHVQLIGRRRRAVVARTRRETLRAGRHELSLTLDPKRWPTKLQFEATPFGGPTPSSGAGGSSESAGPNTIGT
jgi:hypothetical protein